MKEDDKDRAFLIVSLVVSLVVLVAFVTFSFLHVIRRLRKSKEVERTLALIESFRMSIADHESPRRKLKKKTNYRGSNVSFSSKNDSCFFDETSNDSVASVYELARIDQDEVEEAGKTDQHVDKNNNDE